MYIDSHVHYWEIARGDYGWLKPSDPLLYRDYLPEHALPDMTARSVDGVIAVQAAPTEAEAWFLLELSRRHPIIVGVSAGLLPFSDDFAAAVGRLRSDPGFKGVRLGGGDFKRARTDAAARAKLTEGLRTLAAEGLTLDVLAGPDALAAVAAGLEELPELRFVVNHLGSPAAGGTRDATWSEGIERLSGLPNAHVKLSGMLTLSESPEPLRPYVDELFERFGASRLLFGSDWPVALKGGSYADAVERFESLLPPGLDPEALQRVRAGNARAVYGLGK